MKALVFVIFLLFLNSSIQASDIKHPNVSGAFYPADKEKNSVKDGIDFIKRHKLHITNDSINLLREITGYKWKQDKDGNVLDEPVKFKDHLLDAMRYAIYTHEVNRGGTTSFFIG